jgi:hypothetical protein
LIDDLAAERNSPPLPPEPVFTIDLVEAETGKRGRRYVAELEEHAIRNAQAAAEARRIALEQRGHLEAAARGRLEAEREISKLRREMRTVMAEQQRLTARRATLGPGPAPVAPAVPPKPGKQPGGGAARSELTRTREMVEQQQRLLGERREQLVGALRERDEARLEARRARDACERAKRSLARATEMLRHNALEETARIGATSPSTLDAVGEHEQMAAENRVARSELEARVLQLTEEVERLTSRAAELEDALNHETNRADFAASQSAALVAEAQVASEDATSARQDLADALARDAEPLARISELTEQFADVEATAAATLAERDAASARVGKLERQLAAIVDERESASARVQQLEGLLAAMAEERETARSRLAELERMLTAREADETLAARRVAELIDRLAELEATAATTRSERDAASTYSEELERQLAATVEQRETASTHSEELERQLAATVEEREAASTHTETLERQLAATLGERDAVRDHLAELERVATARDADETLGARQVAVLADRFVDLEATAATTVAERDEAQARVAELEELLASDDHDPDDEVLTYVDELQAKLAEAEHGAAAATTRVTELTRTAAKAQATLSGMEEARAADQRRASAELERLTGRIAELELMIVEAKRAPETISDQAMALDELGQLAAQEPAREQDRVAGISDLLPREQPHAPAERAVPVAPAAASAEGDVVVQSDLRRALLANLSELAEVPDRGTDS